MLRVQKRGMSPTVTYGHSAHHIQLKNLSEAQTRNSAPPPRARESKRQLACSVWDLIIGSILQIGKYLLCLSLNYDDLFLALLSCTYLDGHLVRVKAV